MFILNIYLSCMRLNKRFWMVYALLMVCAIWYAVYAITAPEKIVLPYDNPEDVATYKRIDTMKHLTDYQKLVYKRESVILRKKAERLMKKWAIEFHLQLTFDSVAEKIISLASKDLPDEIVNNNLNKPAAYSPTFAADIANFSHQVARLALDTRSIVHNTIIVDPNKVLYKYYYCKHEKGVDKPVGQINMLFDRCISESKCTNIKVFDSAEMDKVYVKPRSMEDEFNN